MADTYRVHELAQIAGVSVRTLHHYEQVGLVVPQREDNGYRSYSAADLERLQQVLLFRECGLALKDIHALMSAPDYKPHEALTRHFETLHARERELHTLIRTVERTIASLEGGSSMTDMERFEGLKRETIKNNEETFGAAARERYGDEAVDAANEALLAMDESEWNDMNELEAAIIEQLKAAMATGDAAGEEARKLAQMHARWIGMHWGANAYNARAHLQLARGYLADERFRSYYDERAGQGACEFLVCALENALS